MEPVFYTVNEANLIANKPGVYKFYDKDKNVIYIGKAKNLKKRVASYFTKKREHTIKINKMVSQILFIEATQVNTEYDALLLENNLIKEIKPKYNILLRDDKTYPYICILNERFPRVIPTRKINEKIGEYYGPFSNVYHMNTILELIRDIFTIRTCNLNLSKSNIDKKKFKICLEYHIKNCQGPCENLQTEESYNNDILQVKNLLKGNFQAVKKQIKEKMLAASNELKFEDAHHYKEKLEAIEAYYAKSLIINPNKKSNIDVFAQIVYSSNTNARVKDSDKYFICYLKIEQGIITFTKTFVLERRLEETEKEILYFAIAHCRSEYKSDAKEIITNIDIDDNFDNNRISKPQVGDKKKLLEIAMQNAYAAKKDAILKNSHESSKADILLETLQRDLSLNKIPKHIECFDNSNLQGTTPVAAMVCYIDARPNKSKYRHFNIKTVTGANDFASMEEIIYRRYKDLKESKIELPDLIIIDGGKGQLNSAIKSLKKLDLVDKIDVISIAKRLEEIYKPNDPIPIHLLKISPSLKFIQKIRNEAHRFAITFHKQKRVKKGIISKLDEIKGIGPKTRAKLIRTFKSVDNIKKTGIVEIEKLIGKNKAEIVKKGLENI